MLLIYFLYRVTARVDVHSHVSGAPATVRQDIQRPSASPAHCNYGYLDDDVDDSEEIVPERRHDWPETQRTRPYSTRQLPGDNLEEMMSSPTVVDPYRRQPAPSEPLSVISGHLSSSAQVDYGRAGASAVDVQRSLNDTCV